MTHEKIAETFDEWAASGRADGMEVRHGDVARQVLEAMEVRPGMQLLDVGCGTGWATRILGKKAPGAQAVGIDVSPGMIAKAEELSDWTSRARYERMTFDSIDFPDGRFDRVFSMEALYYAPDLDAALREIHRVVKPGGTIDCLVDRFKESPASEPWASDVGLGMAWLGEEEWADTFRSIGFEPVETRRLRDARGDDAPTADGHDPALVAALREAGTLWIRGTKPA